MDVRPAPQADLWNPADKGAVECCLCAHRCRIAPGETGVCRVRRNEAGRLVSLVYGRLIARHVDPIEKKPFFHFLPGSSAYSIATVGCNFQCGFCQNGPISQWPRSHPDTETPGEWVDPERVVSEARRSGCHAVAYTYTEPTVFFEYARDCAGLARTEGLKNIFVTNGYATAEAVCDMAGWLDAANVDLKAWNDAFYQRFCKARAEPVKETIRRIHAAGIHLEVTTLLIPGLNDAEDDLKAMAAFLAEVSPDLVWHVTRFHPDFHLRTLPATPDQTIERTLAIGRGAGLRFVYAGNTEKHPDTRCPTCGNLLIRRSGFLASVVGLRGTACTECGAVLPIIVPQP